MQENNNQPLPPELDWSNMKDGIFDKMASIDQKKPSKRKTGYPWKRIGLFLLLFIALTLGLYSISQKNTNDKETGTSNTVQLQDADTHKSASNNLIEMALINQIQDSIESVEEKNLTTKVKKLALNYNETKQSQEPKKSKTTSIDTDQLPKDQQQNEREQNNKETNANEGSTKSITTSMDIDQSDKNQQLDHWELLPHDYKTDGTSFTQNTPNTAQNTILPVKETDSLNSTLQALEIQILPTYPFGKFESYKSYHSILDFHDLDYLNRPSIAADKSPNQLILEGGVTFWNDGDRNSMSDRARYESPLTSFQIQGYFVRNFKRNYFVMAGLQYQQLESKFQYNTTIPDYKIIIKDTVLQVQNNPLTGEQNVIYGDVEQTVQAERRVRHYNRTQLFKVSLAAGKSWRFNSFQFDVYLGGALNSLVQNQGRMLFDNSIIDYNGTSNPLFQNQMTVDGVLGARLHYLLNQNIGVTTGFQTQKSIMNWSNQDNINFYPASFSLQLGLSYSLK